MTSFPATVSGSCNIIKLDRCLTRSALAESAAALAAFKKRQAELPSTVHEAQASMGLSQVLLLSQGWVLDIWIVKTAYVQGEPSTWSCRLRSKPSDS